LQIKEAKHIFFCGVGITDWIAAEAALKMKELTYLHCQNFKLSEVGNNFYCFFKKYPQTPSIFILLDHQKEKY